MAVVRGVKEKVHLPLYDAKVFTTGKKVYEQISGNVIRFFVDVQGKTKLETNQQESGVLSHFNTYEARALRVVVQPMKKRERSPADQKVDEKGKPFPLIHKPHPRDQDNDRFLENFIYNSVTTFIVGEKIMIQAPTWTFPSGAGEANYQTGLTHGEPSPEATFRFAEPVHVDSQQNFRVEIDFPNGVRDALGVAEPYPPIDIALAQDEQVPASRVWVMLDGYLTRDVQ